MDTQTLTKTSKKLRDTFGKIENINLEINTETVSDIYFAFEHFFPEGTVYKSDEPYQRGKFYWNNKQEFIEYVDEKTGIKIDGSDKKLIKKAEEIFFDIAEGKNIKVDNEMKGAPESSVNSNKMAEEQNKEWQERNKLHAEKAQKVREQSDREVREAIAQKQKLAQEQKTTVTQTQTQTQPSFTTEVKPVDDFYSTSTLPPIIIPEDKTEEVEKKETPKKDRAYHPIDVPQKFPIDPRLKDFVVTVVPKDEEKLPTVTLDEKQVETLQRYRKEAIENPESLHDEIVKNITNSIPTEEKTYVPAEEINRQAQKFVEISKELPKKIPEQIVLMNGFSAFTALTDERNPVLKELIPDKTDLKKVVESAQIMAHVGALEQDVSINLTSSFLPPKLQQIYYGYTDTIEFVPVVGTDQKNEGINLNIERIVDEAQEFKEIIQNAPKGEVDESSVGFLGRQPVYIPTTETDLETKEKGSEELPWYKNSKHHTQADMYKGLHKELPIMVDATTPSGKIISGNIINSTFIPSKKGFINTEDVEYTIVQDNQFIPEVTNENGEQIKFDSFNDYSNYLSDARNFGKDYIPRIKFSDGKTLSFNSISEYATYVENLNTSSSSLTSFFQKNKIPILTTAAIGAYSVNNLQLMNYIAQEHGGQMIMYLGVGKNSFSVINTANYVLGGVKKEVYQAGFEFGSKSLKLAITKSGGKITSNALKIGTGTGKIVSKALPGVLSKAITWVAGLSSWATAGLSLAVGWIAGKVIEKIPWEKVKKWGSAILGGIAGLIALPFFGIGGFIGAFAGVTLISTAFGGGLGGYSVASGIGTAVGGIANVAKIAMATALAGIAGPILFILLGFPVIVALILFIINSGAYVVPPSPLDSAFTNSGGGFPIVCSEEKGPISKSDSFSTTSPIGNRAWEITYDLYQGFWCFWNRSPKAPPQYFPNDTLKYPPGYPNLFDYNLFKSNPNPEPNLPGNALYWCTWLVVHSYNGATQTNLWVPNMYNDFKARNKIIDARNASISTIPAGSVVFFHVTTGRSGLNHVGVVYSTDKAGITIVQSNAPTKSFRVPWSTITGVGTMQIVYFGTP